MLATLEITDELDARRRIRRLRQEIELTTQAYQAAKKKRHCEELPHLLRKRTQLIQSLFQTQSELFRWLGSHSVPHQGEE